jgi:hypothetical protein
MPDQNERQEGETGDDATYKNSSASQVDPSDYPTRDAPVERSNGNILDEPADPQAARPDSPMNVDDRQ